jgi:hypothetical protein|tara:strand:+ start:482 stop:2131 length:1650 start_codon:yes stop_codon:yes gene_type:complete
MIIIELVLFTLISLFSIISISGLGKFFINRINRNFFESFFCGFIVISFLLSFLHFFIKIDFYISLPIFLFGFILALKNFKFSTVSINKKYIAYLLIFLILIPMYISQKYHEDFGYYHLPYILNFVNEKIIFGLANSNKAFVHNSIWLNILPFFYIKGNYNLVTLPTFLIYFGFIIFSINQIIKQKENKISCFFLIVTSFYLILKFTRISEFGNDIPAVIFSALSIFNFFRFLEEEDTDKKKNYFFNNFIFASFAILIKFSSIPIILITIYLFFKNYKFLINDIFKIDYIFVYSLCLIFFIQQFIYTGCFIFPSKLTCMDVSWFDKNYLNAGRRLSLINKSYASARGILTPEEFLRNFNWIPFWFNRSYIGISEHLATMIIPLIIFLSILKKNTDQIIFKFKEIKFFTFSIFLGFMFWLNFSPVYRFGIVYFLSIVFLCLLIIYKQKKFSKKIFINLILIFLLFNFSKNIVRITKENKLFFGIKKIENDYIENTKYKNNPIKIFQPDMTANAKKGNGWQGRLCWDIKFLCTKNKVIIEEKKNYLFIKRAN